MGLSSSKSTNKPIYSQQIESAANTVQSAYAANQPRVQATANSLWGLGSDLLARYNAGDPGVRAAANYNNSVLGGRYLAANPQLQAIIDQTGADVANQVNAHLGTRGRTGGDSQAAQLARELAKNEASLRYQDYSAERDRMAKASELAPALASAEYLPLAPAVSALQAGTGLPTDAANQYGAAIGGLLGQYQVRTSQQSPFDNFLKLLSASADAYKAFGFGGK